MTDITTLFRKPKPPATPTDAFALLTRAATDGIPVPHMTVVWNSPSGPEVSMTQCTPEEFAAWTQWLNITPRTVDVSGPVTIADTTRDGVRIYLAIKTTRAAS